METLAQCYEYDSDDEMTLGQPWIVQFPSHVYIQGLQASYDTEQAAHNLQKNGE